MHLLLFDFSSLSLSASSLSVKSAFMLRFVTSISIGHFLIRAISPLQLLRATNDD